MIYFIQCGISGPVKIGFTNSDTRNAVEERLKSLQTGNPVELRVIAVRFGKKGIENELHKQFEMYRLYGEWYQFSDEVQSYIKNNTIALDTIESARWVECIACKKMFLPAPGVKRAFCSAKCRQFKVCLTCGNVFLPERWGYRYCTKVCYLKGH